MNELLESKYLLRAADQRRYAAMLKQVGASMRAIQRLTGLSVLSLIHI